jgi:preprotein translocase subunit SecG
MILALTITHAIVSIALIAIVLLQQGKQQGLSGAIAGAGESFFGKSKARTIDAMLKKFTTVVAALFILNSIGLYLLIANNTEAPLHPHMDDDGTIRQYIEDTGPWGFVDEEGNVWDLETNEIIEGLSADEEGNLIDANGEIVEGHIIAPDGGIREIPQFDLSDLGIDIGDIVME